MSVCAGACTRVRALCGRVCRRERSCARVRAGATPGVRYILYFAEVWLHRAVYPGRGILCACLCVSVMRVRYITGAMQNAHSGAYSGAKTVELKAVDLTLPFCESRL